MNLLQSKKNPDGKRMFVDVYLPQKNRCAYLGIGRGGKQAFFLAPPNDMFWYNWVELFAYQILRCMLDAINSHEMCLFMCVCVCLHVVLCMCLEADMCLYVFFPWLAFKKPLIIVDNYCCSVLWLGHTTEEVLNFSLYFSAIAS